MFIGDVIVEEFFGGGEVGGGAVAQVQ